MRGQLSRKRINHAHAVRDKRQPARRDDLAVERLERAGGGVARVGEGRLAILFPIAIRAVEGGPRPVDLAAQLEHFGPARAVQPQRDALECANVLCDVVAGLTVAAGRRGHQAPGFIAQRYRDAVDFGINRILEIRIVEPLPYAFVEVP